MAGYIWVWFRVPWLQTRLPDESSIMEFLYNDDQEETESGSDHESELLPPKSKTIKFAGAASYATKFNSD